MPRKPALPALQLLHGERTSRVNRQAPRYTLSDGTPPAHLSPAAKRVWVTVVPELLKFSLLTTMDHDALAAYCEAVVTHRAAAKQVARDGVTQVGVHGTVVKHPAVGIMREAAMLIRSLGSEFGLTPSSRQNVRTPTVTTVTDDDFFSHE